MGGAAGHLDQWYGRAHSTRPHPTSSVRPRAVHATSTPSCFHPWVVPQRGMRKLWEPAPSVPDKDHGQALKRGGEE
jgi:hypothetical protein